jgi:ACS family tartrate transporter-like MFS transporter
MSAPPDLQADAQLERRTVRKVMVRLLPLMAAMFLVNFIDRVNVGFAALTMNADIGLSPIAYAWGAGIFFVAYFVFEVPSNLVMERIGARVWMARIMLTWGLVSGATAFVEGPWSFLALRFLLGAAEAGFVPGMLLYVTYWFPPRYRGRAVAWFFIAAPLSSAIAGLLSVPILRMDGFWGFRGWQWMFMLEALPALLLAFVVLGYLVDTPRKAAWLRTEERDWLERQCERPAQQVRAAEQLRTLLDPRVWLLSAIYVGRTTAMYGISLFLPLILQAIGLTNEQTGVVAAVPFAAATVGSVLWAYSSDRHNERHWHSIAAVWLAAIGLTAASAIGPSAWALVAISLAAIGLYAQAVCFWALPPMMLSRTAAAAGIAAINSVGNLGGFIGPYLVGWTAAATGGYRAGVLVLAAFAAASGILGIVLSRLGWDRRALPS